MSSSEGIVKQSATRKRYELKDKILKQYAQYVSDKRGKTATEIAADLLEHKCITVFEIANVPKRVSELKSDSLGYLELVGERVCAKSGVSAMAYRLTDRGEAYLRKHGYIRDARTALPDRSVNVQTGRTVLSALKQSLL